MNLEQYQKFTAETRERRIAWWRDARFGMFIHYGIYSCYGRGEWIRMREGISREEYLDVANTQFNYKSGNAEEWVKLAAAAGMKYAILTTVHHDGFALWNSKTNKYNSVNYGPHIDIVREFVDACRKHGIRVGLYFSLVNWDHEDGGIACIEDLAARERYLTFVDNCMRELMSEYGKIDILWYDGPSPLRNAEEWRSVERNLMIRELQPDILINDRSLVEEDFRNCEDNLVFGPLVGDWEACLRFSHTAFGGVDHPSTLPFKDNAHDIAKYMSICQYGGGNLVYNIAPNADGSIDPYEKETLETVGKWMHKHAEAVYGPTKRGGCGANGISTSAQRGNKVYLYNWIWGGTFARINGYKNAPKSVRCLTNGESVDFRYENGVIYFDNLPEKSPDDILNFAVFEMDFGDDEPIYNLVPSNMIQFMNI